MIAAYQRISRADGDLGKDGKDKSNSIENQKELIQRYISCKESLQNGTRLTASMVSAFIENVFVYDGGRIVVRFKYEQSIQDAVKALHTG